MLTKYQRKRRESSLMKLSTNRVWNVSLIFTLSSSNHQKSSLRGVVLLLWYFFISFWNVVLWPVNWLFERFSVDGGSNSSVSVCVSRNLVRFIDYVFRNIFRGNIEKKRLVSKYQGSTKIQWKSTLIPKIIKCLMSSAPKGISTLVIQIFCHNKNLNK